MSREDATEYRYWAFISYSNKDRSWARWLHRAIETYGIPARLIRHPTPAGDPAPRRFHPLFHDRAELPASPDLGAEIEDALRASRYLIVICSPHAARSQWVNKEIETFLSLGRSGRVLAVIVDGEPNTGDERECFSPALRQAEPIAADARREADGKGNAKLKLLAGMLGVGFDALKQRDTHRRIRRLEAAMAVTLTLSLGFAGLAMYANRQRDRAIKARHQAESILQYLLYDLRDKLEPIGRLDIVRDVQDRVDAYYRDLGIERRDSNTLHNRATAHVNKGDRLWSEGKLADALGEYRAALEITMGLAAADPSNAGWQYDLGISHERIGTVLQKQGDLSGALVAFKKKRELIARLGAADPSNAGWQRDLSVSHNKVGDVLRDQGDLGGALQAYRESLAVAQRLAAADPSNAGWQRDLSVSHNKVGDVLRDQGDLGGALQAYRESLAVAQRLAAADPSNAGWQYDLGISHERIGTVLQEQGDLSGALVAFKKKRELIARLAAADPSNAGWQRDLSVSQGKVGDVLRDQGDLGGALQAYRATEAILQRLAAADPSNAGWQRDLSVSHNKVGDVLRDQGDLGGALQAYRESLAVAQRLAAADPSNAGWQRDLWVSYWNLAIISEKAGSGDAMNCWRKAYTQLAGMKSRGLFLSPQDEQFLQQLRAKVGL